MAEPGSHCSANESFMQPDLGQPFFSHSSGRARILGFTRLPILISLLRFQGHLETFNIFSHLL
jgi:hypothetical protein